MADPVTAPAARTARAVPLAGEVRSRADVAVRRAPLDGHEAEVEADAHVDALDLEAGARRDANALLAVELAVGERRIHRGICEQLPGIPRQVRVEQRRQHAREAVDARRRRRRVVRRRVLEREVALLGRGKQEVRLNVQLHPVAKARRADAHLPLHHRCADRERRIADRGSGARQVRVPARGCYGRRVEERAAQLSVDLGLGARGLAPGAGERCPGSQVGRVLAVTTFDAALSTVP